jgi:hypothetical protein
MNFFNRPVFTHNDVQLADEAPEPNDDSKQKSPDGISNDKLIKAKGKGKK